MKYELLHDTYYGKILVKDGLDSVRMFHKKKPCSITCPHANTMSYLSEDYYVITCGCKELKFKIEKEKV